MAYRSQWMVEGDFRRLKNQDHVAVAPMFHWTDDRVAVHLFTCVVVLSVLRLMARQVQRVGLTMSTGDVMSELAGIRETVLVYSSSRGRPRARRLLTEMTSTQQRLYEVFGLEAFAPRLKLR